MEDFLRDSLGIVEESAVQVTYEEVSNVSFTSVLASIEEEDVNNQDAVEDEPHVKDVLVTRRELSPSLQKQLAQRAALLKLGFDSDKEEGEKNKNDQEELRAGESLEESFGCDADVFHSQEKGSLAGDFQHQENGLPAIQSPEAGLSGVKEASDGGVGRVKQAEEGKDCDNLEEEKMENEVQVDTPEHLGSEKEAKELDEVKEGVGESELWEEGGGCLQSHVRQENAVITQVEYGGGSGIATKGVELEGEASGKGEEVGGNRSTNKNEGNSKNTSYDSGLSQSNDVSLAVNEGEGKVESGAERVVEETLGRNRNVIFLKESFAKDSEAVEGGCRVAMEENKSKVQPFLSLKVKAIASASTTTRTPHLSIDAVMEDFSWFDCPGLKVTEVEDGLQVDVEDRQLGIAAMEGLKHKYVITQQVWNSVFSSSHLW